MPSQGIMSSKKASNQPGLCPVKGQESGLYSQTRAQNQFSCMSLSTTRTMSHCQMLVNHPAFGLLFNVLRTDLQGQLRSDKFLNRTILCKPVSDFISSYPSMSRDPIQPHSFCLVTHIEKKFIYFPFILL